MGTLGPSILQEESGGSCYQGAGDAVTGGL